MNTDPRQQTGHKTPPDSKDCAPAADPADQPKAPPDAPTCTQPKYPDAPKVPEPKTDCKLPDCCPKAPTESPLCLEEAIADQQKLISAAERAKAFKAELEALQGKAKAAKAEYTDEKYKALLELWKKQDRQIKELIDKLSCTHKYWRTQIECFVCPLLYRVREQETRLGGNGALYTTVTSLHDLRYWRLRDKEAKQASFERIKTVLAAWEKPAQTIEKVLADNAKLIDDTLKSLGAGDAGKLIFDVFMKLVPMHLMISPPKDVAVTLIDRKYTDLCKCDPGKPDDCCGPDTGERSVLEQLLKPQPYLVRPDQYYAVVCCLIKQRYLPAKEVLAQAEAELGNADDEIKRVTAAIEDLRKNLETMAKADLAKPFDCCKDKPAEPPRTDGGSPPPPPPAPTPCPPPDPTQTPPAGTDGPAPLAGSAA